MKIKIERGKKQYEVVPCGARCSFRKWGVDFRGKRDYCFDGCYAPRWWRDMLVENKRTGDLSGLREVAKCG